jgi:hypothetical protein
MKKKRVRKPRSDPMWRGVRVKPYFQDAPVVEKSLVGVRIDKPLSVVHKSLTGGSFV